MEILQGKNRKITKASTTHNIKYFKNPNSSYTRDAQGNSDALPKQNIPRQKMVK